MDASILVVDDEPTLVELLKINLSREGYLVRTASDAAAAMDSIRRERPDLILLDIILPDISGTQLTGQLKNNPHFSQIPIILLTAKDADTDMIVGLNMGADDYITKPFNSGVLLARIEAVLRRYYPQGTAKGQILSAGTIKILPESKQVFVESRGIDLTRAEYLILLTLINADGGRVSRDSLLEKISDSQQNPAKRVVDVHVAALRKKLGTARKHIRTAHGQGYYIRNDL